jgi:hypothetical protein
VISTANDAKFSDVDKAVSFWNETLANLGTPFRLGSITYIPEVIPHEDIFRTIFDWQRFDLSRPGYNRRKMVLLNLPAHIRRLNGDVIVALTEADGPSFAMAQRTPGKVLVAIQNRWRLRGRLIQNLIAHELGHVIGLNHNAIPTALMCGHVDYITQCSFEGGAFEKFQPLTEGDRAALLDMYPPHWSDEGPPRRWKGDPPANASVRFGGRVRVAS